MSISLVANQNQAFVNTTTKTLAYGGSGCTAGNLLVATLESNSNILGSNPISDTQGNVWTQDINYIPGGGVYETVWHAVAKTTGANSVTVNLASGNYLIFSISEWHSSVAGSWIVDAPFVGGTDSSLPTQKSPGINTIYANE